MTWAVWRRLPYWKRYETPRALCFSYYDRLAMRYVDGCNAFVGWSQVSLYSLRRAKQNTARVILEHPMVHAKTWMSLMSEEYQHAREEIKTYHSLMPQAVAARMIEEYEVADHINVLSTYSKQTFIDHGVPPEKTTVISPGVDTELFCPSPARGPEVFRVLYVGRMELLKGVHYLLRAWAELSLPNAELWLVGPLLPEMHSFFRRYEGSFQYFPPRERKDLVKIYQQTSAFVLPSVQEGFGLVLLEAMACGVPVIATKNTGGPDVIRDGVDGFVIPSQDIEALKERLIWFYNHQDQIWEMGRNARGRVVGHFSLECYGDRLIANLTAAVRQRG